MKREGLEAIASGPLSFRILRPVQADGDLQDVVFISADRQLVEQHVFEEAARQREPLLPRVPEQVPVGLMRRVVAAAMAGGEVAARLPDVDGQAPWEARPAGCRSGNSG